MFGCLILFAYKHLLFGVVRSPFLRHFLEQVLDMLVQLASAPTSPLGAPPHSHSSHGKQQRHTIASPLPQPSPSQFLCCLYVLQLNQSTAHTRHLDLVEERYLEVSRISSHGVGRRHELLCRTAPDGQCKAGTRSCTNAAPDARRKAI